MFRKRHVCILSICVFSIFFSLITYFTYNINNNNNSDKIISSSTTEYNIDLIEHQIKIKAVNLPDEYKKKHILNDDIINNFIKNINNNGTIYNYKNLWQEFDNLVNKEQIFDGNNTNIGKVIHALKTARILSADNYSKGTQFKLILQLQGNHLAVFKPQWYDKEKIILGNVYAGKDRYGSEILAFYLAAILDLRIVPIAAERSIDIKNELLPVASHILNSTTFNYKNLTCIYGKCFYCKREDPVCTNDEGKLTGAILYYVPGKLESYPSPWRRTYKNNKKAVWETKSNYCSTVKSKISNKILLDLIDVSIFDFLIQNGDRHHYETLNDKVVLIDNGKGLGNPYVNHIDILAPLYQCCVIRHSTWDRLKLFSGNTLKEFLQSFQEIKNVVSSRHFIAIQERLEIIYATIEYCRDRNKFM